MPIGHRIVGRIVSVQGRCSAGHEPGQTFDISCHNTANLCGFFYHDIFPTLQMLQFGGEYPWGDNKDVMVVECLDRANLVKLELRRER